jgi:hypothetical protein
MVPWNKQNRIVSRGVVKDVDINRTVYNALTVVALKCKMPVCCTTNWHRYIK